VRDLNKVYNDRTKGVKFMEKGECTKTFYMALGKIKLQAA